MDVGELTEGKLIEAPFLKGTATVKKFEKRKGYFLLEVVLNETREFKPLRITEAQLNSIRAVSDTFSTMENSEELFFLI